MGTILGLIALVALVVIYRIWRKTSAAQDAAARKLSTVPYRSGEEIATAGYEGKIHEVSPNRKFAAGYCISEDGYTDKDGWFYLRTRLVIVDAQSRSLEKAGPKTEYDSPYPYVAAISDAGNVFSINGIEGQHGDAEERLIAVTQYGERMWSRSLSTKRNPVSAACDQVALSPDGTQLFVEWLGFGVALFDAATGKRRWTRIWKPEETGLDVEFREDGTLVAKFTHAGEAGATSQSFVLDDKATLPKEYHRVRAAAQAEDLAADHRRVIPLLRAAMKAKPPDLERARTLLDGIRPHLDRIPAKHRAKLFRYEGETAFAEGDKRGAVELWKRALSLDPKVGIAGRYKRESAKLEGLNN